MLMQARLGKVQRLGTLTTPGYLEERPMETAEIIVTPEEHSGPDSAALHQTAASVRAYLRVLEGGQERRLTPPKLVFEDGRQIELTPDVCRALHFVLHHIARGDPFAIIPESQMLTTNEAARVLNVSRPFLIQLLKKGEIKHTMVGSHHRMLLGDVLKYKQQRDHQMEDTLQRFVDEGQKAGDYFSD
jgi:excisionase family DNA binding protein